MSDIGNLEGTVTDASTGALLSGVTVQIGDNSANTNNNGVYTITEVSVGSHIITAAKTGYQTYSDTVVVSKGTTVIKNIQITPDGIAPSNTTASNFINDGASSTSSILVTLSISASDNVGVTGYYASESSATPSPNATGWISITSTSIYSSTVSFSLSSGSGTKTVYVWFRDLAENISASASDSITHNISDTTSPSNPTVSINNNEASTNSISVTLSISATEDTGVTGYCAKESSTIPDNNDTCWVSVTSTTFYSATVNFTLSSESLGDNTKTVYVWFRDSTGNISASASDSITLTISDSTAPSSPSISINSGDASTTSTSVTLTLSAADDVGVSGYCATETSTIPASNDTCWTNVISIASYSASVSFTLSSNSGDKTIYIWFKDDAGNISAVASDSITLGLVSSAPTGVTTAVGNKEATISWGSVSDAISYNIYWSTTSGVTKTTGTKITGVTSPYTHTGLTNGTIYYYVVTAINTYGESSESSEVSAKPTTGITTGLISLPKTGQTTVYSTDDDGTLKRGISWPSPRFTVDGTDNCITDNLTGLMWVKSSDYTKRTWQEALDYANNLTLCGYSDWSLPNRKELRSLINYGQSDIVSWLETQGFGNIVSWSSYSSSLWSSTTDASNTVKALYVEMDTGLEGSSYKTDDVYVLPVRTGGSGTIQLPETGQTTCYDTSGNVISCTNTGQDGDIKAGVTWPSSRFTVGTGAETDCIIDNLTGLMWVKSPDSTGRTWGDALTYANNLSLCGYTDWRLPNINELESLTNTEQSNLASWLNAQGFSNLKAHSYCSSTTDTDAISTSFKWNIDMNDGSVGSSWSSGFYVLPVRAGQ